MGLHARVVSLAVGTDPKLRRMLSYWAATAALYAVFVALIGGGSMVGTKTTDRPFTTA